MITDASHPPLNERSFSRDRAEDSENLDEEDFFSPLPDFKGISDLGVDDNLAKGPVLGGSFTLRNISLPLPYAHAPALMSLPLLLS